MKKKLIILNTSQFGTLTDSYKWCQYLKDIYEITYICFDNGLKRMDLQGVSYKYVYRFNNPILRGIWYVIYALFYCLCHRAPVFVVYFEHCDVLPRLLPWKKFHVDIRTLSVNIDDHYNKKKDGMLLKTISYYNSVSFISSGIRQKINPQCRNSYILPLGSDIIDNSLKTWDSIRLLYVGTLQHRDIPKTVEGLCQYVSIYGKEGISYDIVGDGPELDIIKKYISDKKLQDIVFVHGRLPYDELSPYFKKCNVGVSFVPLEPCYQYQPPTKTFEYILSGLYCIATGTCANKEVITQENGILIEDTKDDFMNALKYIRVHSSEFGSEKIRESLLKEYSWESIINNNLIPIIEKLY